MPRKSKYDPGLDLFGNLVSFSGDSEELISFLDTVQTILKRRDQRFRAKLNEMSFDYEESLPDILYTSMIIAAVSLLERQIKIIAEVLRNAVSFPLAYNDISGSLLERLLKYFKASAGIEIDSSNALWQDISGSIAIRNCLVHAGGEVADKRGQSVEAVSFIKRHKHNCIAYDCIVPDSKLAHQILKAVKIFVEKLYGLALKKYPYHSKPRRNRTHFDGACSPLLLPTPRFRIPDNSLYCRLPGKIDALLGLYYSFS